MASFAVLGKALGLSKTRTQELAAEGMPKDIEQARVWIENRPLKRPPVNGINAGKPVDDPKHSKELMSLPPRPEKTGDRLLDELNKTLWLSDMATDAVADAMKNRRIRDISHLTAVASKTSSDAFKAERAYREEMERRGQLILYTAACAEFRKGFDFLLKRFKALPQSMAQKCNPQNPLHAYKVIESSINEILADAQQQYAPEPPAV